VLKSVVDFLQRWADDIAQYGFLGALFGAAGHPVTRAEGRASMALRGGVSAGVPVRNARPSRLAMAANRVGQARSAVAATVEEDRRPLRTADQHFANDADWGPGSGLSQRREPTL
jgi:hypothetical protein